MVQALPHPRTCRAGLAGFEMALDLRDLLQTNILLDGVWHPHVSRWMAYLSSSAQVIIDVGAHCGYFALIARTFAPAPAHIYAFEPNPRLQAQYLRNVELNGFTNMHLAPLGVSDAPGTLTLYVREAFEPGASSRYRVPHFDRTITVPTTTLDNYCDEAGVGHVDVVKMDIEGGEADAISGMRRGLRAGRYGALLLEVHPSHAPPGQLEAMMHDLREAGYVAFRLREDEVDAVGLAGDSLPGEGQLLLVHPEHLPTLQQTDGGRVLVLPARFREIF
jgi:FkbM family methyltransferase